MTVFKEKKEPVFYPSSDGKRMAENTVQFNWLVKIKLGLEQTTQNQNIFVAGDLLWYPEEGNNKLRYAPDVMVAVGRPKGDRGSYLQWKEDNISPQIVIEILSPGNRRGEMQKKLSFYEKYGVEEYIIYNPMKNKLTIYERKGEQLNELTNRVIKWKSKILGFSFNLLEDTLEIFHPNGEPFKTNLELAAEKELAEEKARNAEQKAQNAEQKAQNAEHKAFLLAEKLRAMGINPDEIA